MTISCVKCVCFTFLAMVFFGNNGIRMLPRGRNAGHAVVGCSLDQECSVSALFHPRWAQSL